MKTNDRDLLTITQLCEKVALPFSTVNYYIGIGLINYEEKSAGGYRLFKPGAVRYLEKIKELRGKRYSIPEIRAILKRNKQDGRQ